jgi:large subunit ribosomal protein L15
MVFKVKHLRARRGALGHGPASRARPSTGRDMHSQPAASGRQPAREAGSETKENTDADTRSVPGTRVPKDRKRVGRGHGSRPRRHVRPRHNGQLSAPAAARAPDSRVGRTRCTCACRSCRASRTATVEYAVVNVSASMSVFSTATRSTCDAMFEAGLIKSKTAPVKVLGDGEITKKLTVKVDKVSASLPSPRSRLRGDGRGTVITAIANAFRVPELRARSVHADDHRLYRIGRSSRFPA